MSPSIKELHSKEMKMCEESMIMLISVTIRKGPGVANKDADIQGEIVINSKL